MINKAIFIKRHLKIIFDDILHLINQLRNLFHIAERADHIIIQDLSYLHRILLKTETGKT